MTEDWSCLSQQDTDPYAQICKEAVEDDNKFKLFKRDSRYTAILEHVPYEHGREYVESIQQYEICLLYTSPSPRDGLLSRMPSSA